MSLKRFNSINIVPMIDIMLVLLVIVLTTATFIAKGTIPITLPKSKSAVAIKDKKPIEFYIDANNKIYIGKKELNLSSLSSELKEFNRDKNIYISCDKNSKYESFVSLLDALKELNFKNISIVTKK